MSSLATPPTPSPVPAQNNTAEHVIDMFIIHNRFLDWTSRHSLSRVNRRYHDAIVRLVTRIAPGLPTPKTFAHAARIIQSRWRKCYSYHNAMSCFGCNWRAHLRYILSCLPRWQAYSGREDLRRARRRMALGQIRRMIWSIRRYSLVKVGETVVFHRNRRDAVVVHLRQAAPPLDELKDRLSVHVTADRLLCDFYMQLASIHSRMTSEDVMSFWAVIGS